MSYAFSPADRRRRAEEAARVRRNLNPTREALLAMIVYGREYAAQRGGSMDFWDSLPERRKQSVREWLAWLEEAPREVRS